MNSIILATLEYPPQTGGIATYLANVVACFPEGAVHVLAPEGGETHVADMHSETPIYRRPMLGRIIRPRWLHALYWTDWLCRKEHADVLLVSHLLPMGKIARLLKRHRGIPYAVILHGMDVALALDAGGAKREQARKILSEASLVAANSAFTARLAETAGAAKDKLIVVRPSPGIPTYHTVTPERLADAKAKYGVGDGFTMLSLGRLVPRKGFADAIEAVALMKQEGKKARLIIAGDGPERQRLGKLAVRCEVDDLVSFAGKVPDEDLPGLYAACDAFVMAPRSVGADIEGFGIVYLEANLMGRPVIGSRAGGVPDAVIDGRTGILVEPGSAAAIAEAATKLMDDPALRARLGSQGRDRVIREFSWKVQAASLVERLMALKSEKVRG